MDMWTHFASTLPHIPTDSGLHGCSTGPLRDDRDTVDAATDDASVVVSPGERAVAPEQRDVRRPNHGRKRLA